MPSFKNWRTFNAGITAENKNKNRSSSVVPCKYQLDTFHFTQRELGCCVKVEVHFSFSSISQSRLFIFPSVATCEPVHPSDDYNRVLLKIDEGLSHESDPDDEDEEEEESTDEEDEDSTKYINASHIDVCCFTSFC